MLRRSPRFRSEFVVPARRPPGLSCSVVVHGIHQRPVRGLVVASVRGTTLMTASLTFVSFSRCTRRASTIASDVQASSHSVMRAAIRRICTGCESSPASSPTRSTSALAVGVVVAIVSAVVVTGTVVLVFRTGGAPSASDSGNLTRVRSATDCDCVVVPDAVSRFDAAGAAVATVSGSSCGLTCTLGIGPIKIGSRSLRTFNGLPRVTGVGFHGSQIIAFRRVTSQRRLSTRRFSARLRTMPFGVPIKCSSVLLSRPSQMPSSHADSSLLTNAPGRLHATASPTSKIGFW